jgi:hypothetical protein
MTLRALPGPEVVRARVRKLWDDGRILADWLADGDLFPLTVPLAPPAGAALAERFGEVRAWGLALRAEGRDVRGHGYDLVEREVAHRQLGAQRLPFAAIVPTRADALALAGKGAAFRRFEALAALTRAQAPALMPWLAERPLVALGHADDWEKLLAVCVRFQAAPRPGVHARALEVAGVDTKFVERHEGLLWELLPRVLPAGAFEPAVGRRERAAFARRFGLAAEPPQLRFRALDPAIAPAGFADLAVPLPAFAAWGGPGVRRVYVTENKLNGLAFPDVPGAIVVFGLGYGVGMLAEVPWLAHRELWYWGDLDTHGFAILAELRGLLPQTRSFLMDEATLLAHRAAWGQEPEVRRCVRELLGLTDAERTVYLGLRDDAWGLRVRLEQERVAFGRVRVALEGD